jgi:hypothetical protein
MTKISTILLMMAILLSACQSTNTPVPTTVPNTATPEPTIIPTKVSVSDAEKAAVSDVYQISLIINVDAVLIHEIFSGVQSGEMSDVEAYDNVLNAITVINAVDQQIPQVTPPECVALEWEQIITYQDATKEILAAWSNDEMDIDAVVTEAKAISTSTTDIMIHIEEQLAVTYGMDEASLRNTREETVTMMINELNASTAEVPAE